MALQFPEKTTNYDDYFLMTPMNFTVTTSRSTMRQTAQQTVNTEHAIILPTPASGISLNETGNWDESDGYQHSMTLEGAKDYLGKGMINKLKTSGGALGNALAKGTFVNDYASLAYQGSNFRSFTFAWDLMPASEKEAIEITKIINMIRRHSLPDYNKSVKFLGKDTAAVNFPSMWIVRPAIRNENLFRLKNCVITDFTCNYTPEGVLKTYKTGHPLSVNVELTFKELYRATRTDVYSY